MPDEAARVAIRRAAELEDQLASCQARADDLQSRLRAAIGRDPEEFRTLDLRMVAAESLMIELKSYVRDHPSLEDVLPAGFMARLRGQLDAAVEDCPDCGGSGLRLTMNGPLTPGAPDCPTCRGTGKRIRPSEVLRYAVGANATLGGAVQAALYDPSALHGSQIIGPNLQRAIGTGHWPVGVPATGAVSESPRALLAWVYLRSKHLALIEAHRDLKRRHDALSLKLDSALAALDPEQASDSQLHGAAERGGAV